MVQVVIGDCTGDPQQVQQGYSAAYTDGLLTLEQGNFLNGETAGKDADIAEYFFTNSCSSRPEKTKNVL